MEKTYKPDEIETRWAKHWLDENLFQADVQSEKPSFSIVIPPPNVTGSLHIGHALNNTLQDIFCRYKRMCGFEVLWVPGTDHAGIATQNVVERQLKEEGSSRQEIGREKFTERVWRWKKQSGGQIIHQLKRLGCSCDWSRERFTMDEGLSKAVREVFVRLYDEGLIYRGDYMINWCPRCESALADLEVEYPDEFESGFLYSLAYPLVNPKKGTPKEIIVDTTRPETMLGDMAVAVHPDDERYSEYIGGRVKLPIVGREIPIIADSFVDPEFGSGAVKITPGHDPNDFEAGRRHGLSVLSVIGPHGEMTEKAGEGYRGLDRFECRKKIVKDLEDLGVLKEKRNHLMKTGKCYRCQTVTEPLVSTQWFMQMKEMAEEAAEAVRSGQTQITPKNWEGTYFQWLDNIRDWCISRQLWWGHQIPVWYCADCGGETASIETPKKCAKCGSLSLRQDSDVLDTWFSSALWPFTTLGWPEETTELKKFYPTSVLITGFDILFFWVARMMMMGLKVKNEVPFNDIYLHAMVRDEHGMKMSKTKGNVVDPLDIIDEYGADALRFGLTIMTLQGRDVNLSLSRIEGYRNFINKIWNAVRFVLLGIGSEGQKKCQIRGDKDIAGDLSSRWILSRLRATLEENVEAYGDYQFSNLCSANYRFFWDEFCAWYVEASKLLLKDVEGEERRQVENTLVSVLDVSLRLLYPTIPFVTEELWTYLPEINGKPRETLARASFPSEGDFFEGFLKRDQEAEKQMSLLQDVIVAIRTIRAEKDISPGKELEVFIVGDGDSCALIKEHSSFVQGLARIKELRFEDAPKDSLGKVVSGVQVSVLLTGVIDLKAELIRVKKEIGEMKKELLRVQEKLANESFLERAPKAVIQKERGKQEEYQKKLQALEASKKELGNG